MKGSIFKGPAGYVQRSEPAGLTFCSRVRPRAPTQNKEKWTIERINFQRSSWIRSNVVNQLDKNVAPGLGRGPQPRTKKSGPSKEFIFKRSSSYKRSEPAGLNRCSRVRPRASTQNKEKYTIERIHLTIERTHFQRSSWIRSNVVNQLD